MIHDFVLLASITRGAVFYAQQYKGQSLTFQQMRWSSSSFGKFKRYIGKEC